MDALCLTAPNYVITKKKIGLKMVLYIWNVLIKTEYLKFLLVLVVLKKNCTGFYQEAQLVLSQLFQESTY